MDKSKIVKAEDVRAAHNAQSKAEKILDKIEEIIISDFKNGISGRTTVYKIVEVLGEE